MYSFRKSKKGFTLIELMVVVAIIGVLALLGLRVYIGQQRRAKDAIALANAATIHTLIQGNLVDKTYALLDETPALEEAIGGGVAFDELTNEANTANLRNPYDSTDGTVVAAADTADITVAPSGADATGYIQGVVYIFLSATEIMHGRAVGDGTTGGPVWVGNLLTALKYKNE